MLKIKLPTVAEFDGSRQTHGERFAMEHLPINHGETHITWTQDPEAIYTEHFLSEVIRKVMTRRYTMYTFYVAGLSKHTLAELRTAASYHDSVIQWVTTPRVLHDNSDKSPIFIPHASMRPARASGLKHLVGYDKVFRTVQPIPGGHQVTLAYYDGVPYAVVVPATSKEPDTVAWKRIARSAEGSSLIAQRIPFEEVEIEDVADLQENVIYFREGQYNKYLFTTSMPITRKLKMHLTIPVGA